MNAFDLTPEEVSNGRVVLDRDLSMLAAVWLADGYDSPSLRALAAVDHSGMSASRALLEDALAEMGHPVRQYVYPDEEAPWRGYWSAIEWARDQMDRTHSPYASAQRVLEILDDIPDLWEPGGGPELAGLLADWDVSRERRPQIDEEIRTRLRALTSADVPPLVEP